MKPEKESLHPVPGERKTRIAMLNDRLRMHGLGGKMMITRGIADLGEETVRNVLQVMRQHSAWTKDNDPYGEHDFGVITLADGLKAYFKIDYYDALMEYGSDDPADPEKTVRVLTLMLPEEY